MLLKLDRCDTNLLAFVRDYSIAFSRVEHKAQNRVYY